MCGQIAGVCCEIPSVSPQNVCFAYMNVICVSSRYRSFHVYESEVHMALFVLRMTWLCNHPDLVLRCDLGGKPVACMHSRSRAE